MSVLYLGQPSPKNLQAPNHYSMKKVAAATDASLSTLVQQCDQETEHFFQNSTINTHHCLELFRRAIFQKDEIAWDAIYHQYEKQVSHWIRSHPSWGSTGETEDYFINLVFARFWKAMTPEKFSHFTALKEILRYLKICVHSVIIDYVRARARITPDADATYVTPASKKAQPDVHILNNLQQSALLAHMQQYLHNEQERHIFECCIVLGLKPGEVYKLNPHIYTNVADVYRIKGNLLRRLRRDENLKLLLKNG